MDIRSYTKQELALLYFPDSSPVVASAHLMRWICRNPDLLKKLHESGYDKNSKEFTPMQISYIILKSATIIQYTIKGRFMSR
jgi:hypothetical protein